MKSAHLNDRSGAILRHTARHSHIGIRLHVRVNAKWERIEALGWNEVGFNFFLMHDLGDAALELKRSLTRFDATIVWRARNTLDEFMMVALVNEMIFAQAKQVANNQTLHHRLMKLMRTPGMLAEKRQILSSLGLDLSDATMASMLHQRKQERPIFQYGVKVESAAWCNIVKDALKISSVVISLEKWSDALGGGGL